MLDDNVLFNAAARLEKQDFIEAEKLVKVQPVFIRLLRIIAVIMGAIGVLYLLMMPLMSQASSAKMAVVLIVLSAAELLITAPSKRLGKLRANAPMNQNRNANIKLLTDRIIYCDEFVRLAAHYSDVMQVIKGRTVFVITFDGADYIIVPIRAFGRENCKSAESFLRETLQDKFKGR